MDTFTLLITILLIMLALQMHQGWMVFAIVAVMIFAMRSLLTGVILIAATFVMYFLIGAELLTTYWPFIIVGVLLISLLVGNKEKQQPEMYQPSDYGDLLGGMGGGLGGGY